MRGGSAGGAWAAMADTDTGLSSRFVRDWLRPQWGWFALGALFAALSAATAYGYGEILQRATDWLRDARSARLHDRAVGHRRARAACAAPALYWQTQANNHGVQNAIVELQHALFGKLIDGDFARLQAAASGEYVSQFANDMTLIREASLRVATNLAKSTLTILAAVIFMLVNGLAARAAAPRRLSDRVLARRAARRPHPRRRRAARRSRQAS